jgi:hypothetical protein
VIVLLVASLTASAVDLDRFPLQATVSLPECKNCAEGQGVYRVPVPPGLRTPDDPVGASDLVLVNADGDVIPVAIARGSDTPERAHLRVWPSRDYRVFEVEKTDRPIDGLQVDLPREPSIAEVRVEAKVNGAWVSWGEPQRVWQHSLGDANQVDLPATRGPLRVEITPVVGAWWLRRPSVDGFRRSDADVRDVKLRLPVVASQLQEDGWSRHVVPLPAALPIRSITLHAEGDVFERPVAFQDHVREPGGYLEASGVVRRIDFGGAAVDMTTVGAPEGLAGDRLYVYVEDNANSALVVPEVTVQIDGLELLVRDPGPGPWTLYGGAPIRTAPVHDLNVAASELRRLSDATAIVSEVAPNGLYTTPEDRSGLSGPGPLIDVSKYRWRHGVTGGPGLVRVPLPSDVVGSGQPGAVDLRLLTAEGAQVPLVIRRSGVEPDWGNLDITRTEKGQQSILRVAMPAPNVPVASVTLHTSALLFDRRVTINRVAGPTLDPLRSFDWRGADRPAEVSVTLGQVVGDELVIIIDNGDDPPLPVDSVSATWPGWELLTVLPDEPVWLYGGAKDSPPPHYDLELLSGELSRRAAAEAAVGPREVLEALPPSPLDRLLLFGGLGVLVVGLGVLTFRLVRAVPADDDEEEGEDEGSATPDEGSATADEESAAPDEGVAAPDEGVAAPDEGVAAPDEGVATLDEGSALPDEVESGQDESASEEAG